MYGNAFVDSNFLFAARGCELYHENYSDLPQTNTNIHSVQLVSQNENENEVDIDNDNTIGHLIEYCHTKYGFFGQMSNFKYDSSLEMEFGLPKEGDAQIYMEISNGKSGWYDCKISRADIKTDETGYEEVSFVFTDPDLPEDYLQSYIVFGAPIIQNSKIVAVFSSIATFSDPKYAHGELMYFRANLAADMRFVQLQKYDNTFNAELYSDVSTLKDYFN